MLTFTIQMACTQLYSYLVLKILPRQTKRISTRIKNTKCGCVMKEKKENSSQRIRFNGLLSPIRHAKVPHGLSRQIIRARSAKMQSDLAIVTFVPNTIATKNPRPIVMRPTMKRPTLFSCPSPMTPNPTRQYQLRASPNTNRRNRHQSPWRQLACILSPYALVSVCNNFVRDTFRDNLPHQLQLIMKISAFQKGTFYCRKVARRVIPQQPELP